jgi:hypothetical protein
MGTTVQCIVADLDILVICAALCGDIRPFPKRKTPYISSSVRSALIHKERPKSWLEVMKAPSSTVGSNKRKLPSQWAHINNNLSHDQISSAFSVNNATKTKVKEIGFLQKWVNLELFLPLWPILVIMMMAAQSGLAELVIWYHNLIPTKKTQKKSVFQLLQSRWPQAFPLIEKHQRVPVKVPRFRESMLTLEPYIAVGGPGFKPQPPHPGRKWRRIFDTPKPPPTPGCWRSPFNLTLRPCMIGTVLFQGAKIVRHT